MIPLAPPLGKAFFALFFHGFPRPRSRRRLRRKSRNISSFYDFLSGFSKLLSALIDSHHGKEVSETMTRTIAIIDADICFTSLLISRLKKHVPELLAFPVSQEMLMAHRELLLDSDFVLYNQNEITEKEILSHCVSGRTPILVPLLQTTKPYPPKDVLMISHEVETLAGLGRIPASPDSSVQTCLVLSFVPPKEREAHVISQIERSGANFAHIVRLDVMPGILMPKDPPSWEEEKKNRTSGITELLSKLKTGKFPPQSIPSYLEPDPYGDLRFGKPEHSDDLITCHSRTILILIQKTVRYLSTLSEPSLLLVVCDGLSFTRMRTLSRKLRHLEIITPLHLEKDYMLCNEIDELQKEHVGTTHVDYPFKITKKAI